MTDQQAEDFAERLKIAIKATGLSVNAFAQACDIAEGSFRNYFNATIPSADKALRIAQAAKVSLEWLISGVGEMRPTWQVQSQQQLMTAAMPTNDVSSPSEFNVAVHQVDAYASAGTGVFSEQPEIIDTHYFSKKLLHSLGIYGHRNVIIFVRGDSMEPTLSNGDIIMVDQSEKTITANGIYVLIIEGAVFVKRIIRKANGAILLISDNKEFYPVEEITAEEGRSLKIAGRVVWHAREL